MRISTNILSLSAQRTLAQTSKALARAMERLASGSRVNTARDDAAALGIGSGLEAQRRGMLQAVRNMNDARGFLDTADGALSVQTDIVQRLRELAMQAANGTNSNADRGYLETEFQQLLSEFNRITSQTNFNGVNLLDGTFATRALQVGAEKGQSIDFSFGNMLASQVFTETTTIATSSVASGSFQARTTTTMNSYLQTDTLAAGDVNGDGRIDLLTPSYFGTAVQLALGNGNGTFQSKVSVGGFNGSMNSVTTADVNGDGNLDVIATDSSLDQVNISLGNGNGTFQTRRTIVSGGGVFTAIGRDFNGDGKIDLAVADRTSDTLSLMLGNGDGTFAARTTLTTGANPVDVSAADFNGDGKLDLISGEQTGNSSSVFLGNGNGTFIARSNFSFGNYPKSVVTVDVNNDNKIDVVSALLNSGSVTVALGNGNGTFQARTTIVMGGSPYSATAIDINGDGRIDIVSTDSADDTLSIAFGNGNGTFLARTTLATGTTPGGLVAVDVNGDSIVDLMTSDFNSNTISIFIGGSTTITTGGVAAANMTIANQSSAQDALAVLDGGLTYVNTARASIGAVQSRLDFAQSNALNLVENLSAARSQLMDADYAQEVADFTRLQILQQAGISVLSQANMSSKLALDLLRNL